MKREREGRGRKRGKGRGMEEERERKGREREGGEMEGKRDGECSACLSGPELRYVGTILKGLLRLSALASYMELTHTVRSLQVIARKKMGRGATMLRMIRMEKTKSCTWGEEKQG